MSSAEQKAPISFIISAPRSGSTWLARALGCHGDILATENRFFGEFCEVWPDATGAPLPRITFDKYARSLSQHVAYDAMDMNRAQFIRGLQRAYHRFFLNFCLRKSEKQYVIDKITPYDETSSIVLDGIQEFFPQSKIVLLIRDGRDVTTSAVFDWLQKDGHQTDRFRFFVERRPELVLDRFFDDESLERWAHVWVEPLKLIETQNVPHLEVRYESMQADQSQVVKSICDYFGIVCTAEQADACASKSTFERMSGRKAGDHEPLAKARKGIVGDWRNYFTRRDGEIFDAIAGSELRRLGYVTDDGWVKLLPESIDLRASR